MQGRAWWTRGGGLAGAAWLCAVGCETSPTPDGDTDVAAVDTDVSDGTTTEDFAIGPVTDEAVLWVVDNSCSMVEEQAQLSSTAHTFFGHLQSSTMNWHVGVVTTDVEDSDENGKLIRVDGEAFVDNSTSSPTSVFSTMIQAGSSGSAVERGLLAADRALTMPTPALQTANQGFVPPGARVTVVVVSDEDDQSAPALTRAEFVQHMQALPDVSEVNLFALVGPPDGCETTNTQALPGTNYGSVAVALGGRAFSLCDSFDPALDFIGGAAAADQSVFTLAVAPDPADVAVWVTNGDGMRLEGLAAAQRQADETVAQACARLGLGSCFAYTVDGATLRLVGLDTQAPATLHVRYPSPL